MWFRGVFRHTTYRNEKNFVVIFNPKTIENLHLPGMFKTERLTNTSKRIKRTIIKSMIRHLYAEIHQTASTIRSLNTSMHTQAPDKATNLIQESKQVKQRAKSHHYFRLKKKLLNLNKPDSQRTINTTKVTDMTNTLKSEEIDLLAKGPKFALTPKPNDILKTDIQASFCRTAYQLRWLSVNNARNNSNHDNSNHSLPTLKSSTYIHKPPINNADLENRLKMAYNDVKKLLNSKEFNNNKPNLTRNEQKTLKELKQKPLTYLPSDKGGEFCVIETDRYNTAALQHLSDTTIYKPTSRMTAKTIESKINKTWSKVSSESNLETKLRRMYNTTNSQMPRFYHLVKTHKNVPEIKIRPIVSNSNGPTYKISWMLTQLLKPLLSEVPAHLENSFTLINDINNLSNEQRKLHPYPFSLDVIALYTSIPPKEAINNVLQFLHTKPETCKPLRPEHVSTLLECILDNTFFQFNGAIFRQISGLPMGNSISGLLAILFMGTLERNALASYNNFSIYRRYVDDICIVTTSKSEADKIFQLLNSQHPMIKFEIEYPDTSNSLSLLDFQFNIDPDGAVTFNFFQKTAKKQLFPHAQSAIPLNTKITIAKNELQRRLARSSTPQSRQHNTEAFKDLLLTNGYDENFTHSITKPERRTPRQQLTEKHAYFKFPFLNNSIDRKIKDILRSHNLPIRIYRRPTTLRNVLKQRNIPKTCDINQCRLNNELCMISNCVYSLRCDKCNQLYIGSCIRHFHIRFKEHLNDTKSSVFKHSLSCKSTFSPSILSRDIDTINLRFKESIFISKLSPTINSKTEREELMYLIY